MKNYLLALVLGVAALGAQAVEMEISAKEVYEKVQGNDPGVLFVDVRDPLEIMFTGFTDVVHVNIPYLLADRTRWEDERSIYRLYRNPDFVAQIKAELARRGMKEDAEVITLCRSGSERGKPSAQFLRDNGLPNARYVVNGFQGSPVKDGPQAGLRIVNGWQNSGLPWSAKMSPGKMFRVDK
ncbi:MAG: rhodanese-like domain-containing protein [Alicycliphilus sp.]|jgi:rhodanese-related sulfurtransferase|nr:sulfurtransferase [Pseudomonadota bacterium]HRO53513.1 rhodanese-like domain-containing protein [Alicycliphilus sp.]HRP20597.1 rhodanese-like domain-containing protein [Alicycliphilus sp.]